MTTSLFSQTSDQFKFLLTSLILFVNHGSRDYLITGLPSFISCPGNDRDPSPNQNDTYGGLKNSMQQDEIVDNFFAALGQGSSIKEGWTSLLIGGTLSCVHLGWFVTLSASPLLMKRIPIHFLAGFSLLTSGALSLCMEWMANISFVALLIARTVQGTLQGLTYPVAFTLLEEVEVPNFVIPHFFIFLAPWVGSGLAVLMGWTQSPFIAAYVFGALGILCGGFIFYGPVNTVKSKEKPKHAWRECLTSNAIWSCTLLQLAMAWSLHHFLIGLSLTMEFKLQRRDLMWTIFVTLITTGLFSRIIATFTINFLRSRCFSPLNRRRFIILIGLVIIVASLVVITVTGMDVAFATLIMTLAGAVFGVSVGFLGVRLNFHDLGPLFPTPVLILGSAGASVGSGAASLLFPLLSQVGRLSSSSLDEISDGTWQIAWAYPIPILVVAWCANLFLVSVIPLPHQTLITFPTNGIASSSPKLVLPNVEADTRSFKTSKSAISFKTAVSKPRTTISFKTVNENCEVDLQTIPESETRVCYSVAQDDAEELKSVVSGATSFKSAAERGAQTEEGIILSPRDLDRTSAWLTAHHNLGVKLESWNSAEKLRIERNILVALQW